jgi:hypothetical protein
MMRVNREKLERALLGGVRPRFTRVAAPAKSPGCGDEAICGNLRHLRMILQSLDSGRGETAPHTFIEARQRLVAIVGVDE